MGERRPLPPQTQIFAKLGGRGDMRQTENISQIKTVSVFAENIISVKGMSDKNI